MIPLSLTISWATAVRNCLHYTFYNWCTLPPLTSLGHNYIKYREDFALEGQQAAPCWAQQSDERRWKGFIQSCKYSQGQQKFSGQQILHPTKIGDYFIQFAWSLPIKTCKTNNQPFYFKRCRFWYWIMWCDIVITLRRSILSGSCLMAGAGSRVTLGFN